MDLFYEITNLTKYLDTLVINLKENGVKKAESEKEYKIVLRQEALKLKTEKNMPVTLINQIVYGIPEVAKLRLDRDIKETIYQANLEAINVTKLKLRILENQLNREWGISGKGKI
jgi:hypothetical protein